MFTRRFFILLGICIVAAIAASYWSWLLPVVIWAVVALLALFVIDALITLVASWRIVARRTHNDHLSFGQPNVVTLDIAHKLPAVFKHMFKIVAYDTVPNGFSRQGIYEIKGEGRYTYHVVPHGRGRHEFGVTRCFVRSVIGLCEIRRFLRQPSIAKVYPTFHSLDKLEMIAMHQNTRSGEKRIRRAANSTNFEQIRAYVPGDDVRTINWRATARAVNLMVNTYTDERSQPIISVVCAGPSMLIASEGITLLDRATSAAVALSSAAMRHYDEAGLLTVTHQGVETYLAPERSSSTLAKILDYTYAFGLPPTATEKQYIDDVDVVADDIGVEEFDRLYKRQQACEADPDFDALASYALTHIRRKSLLVLFANFENLEVAKQVMPALQRMSKRHKLVVVLFVNESVADTARAPYKKDAKVSNKLSEMRFRTLCAEYIEQQQLMAAYMRQQHINVILTNPADLTGAVLSEYLEIKNRAAL